MSSASIPDTAPTTSADAPPTTTPFRFKRKRKSVTSPSPTQSPAPKSTHHHHHRRRHHHHRHHRHEAPRSPSPFTPDPETAFRESLFDAMADDEGALYWESVYGQPLHTYSQYYDKTNTSSSNTHAADANGNEEGEAGKAANVQKMTEDEYVDYVRRKMWEKSHGYVLEERARREEEMKRRKNMKKDNMREEEEREDRREWERGVEEALRRGEERRKKARWKGAWEGYVRRWEEMRWSNNDDDGDEDMAKGAETKKKKRKNRGLRAGISWPVESGKYEDVSKDTVEFFFTHAPSAASPHSSATPLNLEQILKKERIRWHPDKMQQRARAGGAEGAGGPGMDAETLKIVTAVFQIVDRLWSEVKGGGT